MYVIYEAVGRFTDWYFGLPDKFLMGVGVVSLIFIAVFSFLAIRDMVNDAGE